MSAISAWLSSYDVIFSVIHKNLIFFHFHFAKTSLVVLVSTQIRMMSEMVGFVNYY